MVFPEESYDGSSSTDYHQGVYSENQLQSLPQHSTTDDDSSNSSSDMALASTSHRVLSSSPSFTVTIDILTVALVSSAFLYMICFRLARHKLKVLHRLQPQMTSKKLLILGVLLVSVLRIMTILGVAAMNMANVRAHYSLQPSRQSTGDKTQDFYDEAMTVLFDLPNCIVVSTYVLLTLVWAECFLESRFHTENAIYWKRRLLIFFMIFNTLLYATQLVLYACIFFSGSKTEVRIILYAAITGINFTAVSLVLAFYVYLNLRFSGFPYRNEELRQSLARVSSVMTLWSVTRVIWGVCTLLVYLHNIELLQDSHTPVRSFVVMFIVFFICEIVPIVVLLDYSYYMQTLIIGRFLATAGEQSTAAALLYDMDEDDASFSENHNIDSSQRGNNHMGVANAAGTEGDSLLLQRQLPTMDRLLLTTPKNDASSQHNSSGKRDSSRRVRFQGEEAVVDDPILESL